MDGTKMSKSKGNLIAPDHYFDTVGADALRLFHLFVGPPGDDMDWTEQTDEVIEGCGRFLDRLWRTVTTEPAAAHRRADGRDRAVRRAVHRTIAASRGTSSAGPTTRRWPTDGAAQSRAALRARTRAERPATATGRRARRRVERGARCGPLVLPP